jgi:hypothetical protein
VSEEPAAEPEDGWLLPVLLFGGFNLLLIGGGLGWYLLHRRRAAGTADAGFADLLDVPGGEGSQASLGADELPKESAA